MCFIYAVNTMYIFLLVYFDCSSSTCVYLVNLGKYIVFVTLFWLITAIVIATVEKALGPKDTRGPKPQTHEQEAFG